MDTQLHRSPWWYRNRAALFGVIYGAGFILGRARIGGGSTEIAAVAWGTRLGGDGWIAALVWASVAGALLAFVVRALGTAYLRRDVVFAADAKADRLIVAGPFRFVRNPLYLGNMFLAVGIGLLAPPLGFAIIVLGNAVLVGMLAAEEARHLRLRYGATYDAYAQAVPAFVPRLTPATVPGSASSVPSWRSGIFGELGMFGVTVSVLPIAIAGPAGLPLAYGIGALTLVSALAINWRPKRRTPNSAH